MAAPFEIRKFADDKALSAAAARDWLELVKQSTGRYSVAFSGGRIAKTFFQEVAKLAAANPNLLANVHYFWTDERCVPPSDPESNFRLAKENLFDPIGAPEGNIHRLKGELPPVEAVSDAIREVKATLPSPPSEIPAFDMIFLGMGEDGHIASLMPNAKASVLECREVFVHVDNSPKPPPNRLTMTYPVLAKAKNVWALVASAGKTKALRESMSPGGGTPFARVLRSRAKSIVYTDLNEG